MSFANYDEIHEVCCEMAREELLEAELLKADLIKRVSPIENNDKWWEKAAKEVLDEKEKELAGV